MDEVDRAVINAFYPRQTKHLESTQRVVEKLIVGNYAPATPVISPDDTVACIGSCFAEEMAKSLAAQGRSVAPIFLSERWSNPFAVARFVDHALNRTPLPPAFIPEGVEAEHLLGLMGSLDTAKAIIVTLGLSLCWYDLKSGEMVLDIPASHSTKGVFAGLGQYTMRQTGVGENVQAIMSFVQTIQKSKPGVPVILTVSPIPLLISVTDYPVVASNNISKAVLRAAVHEVMERQLDAVYYWPSYDIVEWFAKYQGPLYGQDGADLRHLSPGIVADIMAAFAQYYFRKS